MKLTKVRSDLDETLFVRSALKSCALKNKYRLPFYLDNACGSQFAQCGSYGFSMQAKVVGQLLVSHACHYAVLRFFQQQGCEARNQTLTSESLHAVQKVR